ncbi:MAG TPA: YybS family protein [Firmicutes bacterium]|nr:YybS family protein [Bacillota bacterium]
MTRSDNTRVLVESALLVAISTLFCVLDAYIPIFALVYPLPIVILVVRRGLRAGVWATVVTIAATSMFVGPFQGLLVFTKVGIIGITLAQCIRKQFSPVKTVAITAVAVAVSMAFTIGVNLLIGGFGIEETWEMMQKSMDSAIEFYRRIGVAESEISRMETYLSQITEAAKIVLPASLLMVVVTVAGFNYLVARLILGKLGHKLAELKPFLKWRLSWHYGWGYVAGLILASIGQVAAVPLVSNIGTNVMSVFGMVFLVQGAAVAWYFFDKYKLLPIAKWLIMIFIVLNPTLLQILSWAGVLDAWLDFRKLSS